MQFIYYDLAIFAIFCIFVIFFLYSKRKKVQREGILFLYRTKAGINGIERLNKKFGGLWKFLGPVVIVFGFLFMISIFILLIQSVILTVAVPTNIPPIMPLVPYIDKIVPNLPPFYFTYWIVIIAIVAVTHEFAHGIFARKHKIKVKSTGFGFLGPFLLAFVEPDEREMAKKKKRGQLEILAAGSFSNFTFAIIFALLMQLFFVAAYQPAGMAYALDYTKVNLSEITSIGDYTADGFLNLSDKDLKEINETLEVKTDDASYWMTPELIGTVPFYRKTIEKQHAISAFKDAPAFKANLSGGLISIDGVKLKSPEQISEVLSEYSPGRTVVVETTQGTYNIVLAENPTNSEKGYLGIAFPQYSKGSVSAFISKMTSPFFSPYIFIEARFNEQVTEFFADLFVWLVLICLLVALFNMLPVGFLDGGKFFYLSMLALTKSKKKAEILFKISSYAVLAIFILLVLAWLLG